MSDTAAAPTTRPPCRWCDVFHAGPCPWVKAIEYYENGVTKRVEFRQPQPVIACTVPNSPNISTVAGVSVAPALFA